MTVKWLPEIFLKTLKVVGLWSILCYHYLLLWKTNTTINSSLYLLNSLPTGCEHSPGKARVVGCPQSWEWQMSLQTKGQVCSWTCNCGTRSQSSTRHANTKIKPKPQRSPSSNVIAEAQSLAGEGWVTSRFSQTQVSSIDMVIFCRPGYLQSVLLALINDSLHKASLGDNMTKLFCPRVLTVQRDH